MADQPVFAACSDRITGPRSGRVWARLAAGCHPHRDIPGAIRSVGFSITDLERFAMPRSNPLVRTAAQGVARP
jgi:hypothetical protein